MGRETKEIRLELLVPFNKHLGQMYKGDRLQQMMNSIRQSGLINPIIVRPADNGKYEIICGHNRVEAVKALGYDSILADIRYELSDNEANLLFYDSNLNQQSFLDWSYSQKIDAIKYFEKLMKENSQQGKRTDLEMKNCAKQEDGTYVQSRQKLDGKPKRTTTRDKMAQSLGISTATLSKYRRIVKLPDDLIQVIARLLDEKKISFDAAHRISGLDVSDIRTLVKHIDEASDKKIDMDKLKALCSRRKGNGLIPVMSKREIKDILVTEDTILISRRCR